MSDKEKLVELLREVQYLGGLEEKIAAHLIANGVTMQEWIPASEPPTQKDADKYGRVLAMEMGMMALVNYKAPINYPDRFPYWMPLPEPPKEG
jgi:hypothetical protein